MPQLAEFPAGVIEKLGYYVYVLIDPSTDRPFYIGKGTRNRVFAHVDAALVSPIQSDKLDTIRSIHASGQQVKCRIIRHGLTEKEAFEIEAALIDFVGLPELTNIVAGYQSSGRGAMSIPDLIASYDAPNIEIIEPAILVLVNREYRRGIDDDRLFEITRGNWVIGERRNKAKYAFSVYNGIVRQVYEITGWFPAKARKAEQKQQARWRFEGTVATALQHYVGRSVSQYLRQGAQNPIRYVNC